MKTTIQVKKNLIEEIVTILSNFDLTRRESQISMWSAVSNRNKLLKSFNLRVSCRK